VSSDDFPIASAAARKLAEHDLAVLNSAEPPGFRLNRTQLRLEVALRNGLGQKEAERLQALDLPQTLAGRVRHLTRRYRAWTRAQGRHRSFAAAAAFAGLCFAGLCFAGLWLTGWNPGGPLVVKLEASAEAYHHVLEDGSVIKLEPGAVGTLSIVERDVRFELQRGLAEFDVVHGLERRWDVAAAGYLVSVLGTQFSVRYEPDQFDVSVQRGAVAVRLPGQESVLRLLPGDALAAKPGEVTLRHGPETSQDHASQESTAQKSELEPSGENAAPAATNATSARSSNTKSAGPKSAATKSSSSGSLTAAGSRLASQAEDGARRDSNERRLLTQARHALAEGEHRLALKALESHARRYPEGQLVEEREALRIEALRGLGRERAAQSAAGQFRQRFPKSVLAPQMPASVPQTPDTERSSKP
jgi:hypothetical protein